MKKLSVSIFMLTLLWAVPSFADSPLLPIQGRLLDAAGYPIDEAQNVTFAIYPAATGSAAVYQETQTIGFTGGHFVAYLGDVVALDPSLFDGAPRLWLGITIQGDTEMQPRFRLGSAPTAGFAHMCGDAATLAGLDASELALATHTHSEFETYVVDANGGTWPVTDFTGATGKLYMAEWDWFVEFSVIGPEDPEFTGERWLARIVTAPVINTANRYASADCSGVPFTTSPIGCNNGSLVPVDQWRPVAPYYFGEQVVALGARLSDSIVSQSYDDGNGNCVQEVLALSNLPDLNFPDLDWAWCTLVDATPAYWPGPPPSPLRVVFPQP